MVTKALNILTKRIKSTILIESLNQNYYFLPKQTKLSGASMLNDLLAVGLLLSLFTLCLGCNYQLIL